MDLAGITPADYNPRSISAEALGRLTKSVAEFGNLSPVTLNVRTGNLVGGHQRVKCLLAMGHKETDVWCVDLPPEKEKAANLTLNNLAGEWNEDGLADILRGLREGGVDLDVTGFSDTRLEEILGEFNANDADMPDLKQGDFDGLHNMVFSLTDPQKALVEEAVRLAKAEGGLRDEGNSNGNALARICERFCQGHPDPAH
jgi:ParB-like chromosome segregation protein Spo0J